MNPVLKQLIVGIGCLSTLAAVAEDNVDPVAHVQVATVRMEQTTQQIAAYGRLVPAADGTVQITAPFGCRVIKVRVAESQAVKQGDVLFEIVPDPDSQSMLTTARQTLAAAKQKLKEANARFDLKLADRQEVLNAQQTVDEAQLRLDNLTAQGLGGNGKLKAPCNGIVQPVVVKTGDLLGTGTSLTGIERLDRRELIVGVEADKAAQLAIGQTCTARAVLHDGKKPFSGHILRIGRTIDSSSGLVQVATALDDADALATQEYLEVHFDVDPREALVIPASAVLPDENELIAFTVRDGHAVRHSVKTEALADGILRLIDSDLKAGDQVVTLGNYELEDGMKVAVEEAP